MGLKTSQEYRDSIKAMKTRLYFAGEKIENLLEHPITRPVINALALDYDLARDPASEALTTTVSHLTGKKINRFTHIPQSGQDIVDRVRMMRWLAHQHGSCMGGRCVGLDALCAAYSVTYDMDRKLGTDYHQRFRKFLEYVQENDLCVAGAITDAKGDRKLAPAEQDDPDMYVRIVEKRPDGIVIRGAKAHISGAAFAHEMVVMPTNAMDANNKAYAVAFAIQPDAPGITHILEGAAPNQRRPYAGEIDLGNPEYGVHGASLIIFEDVFVPNERVFMCEEFEFTAPLVFRFADMHRLGFSGCKAGHCDVVAGACAVAAEYNGVEKAAHIKEKLIDINLAGELAYGSAIASGTLGYPTPSGCYFPDRALVNAAKLQGVKAVWEAAYQASDIAGGVICTAPTQKDLEHPEVGKYVQKYYRGKAGVSAEDRIRISRYLEFAIGEGSLIPAEATSGGGSPTAQRLTLRAAIDYDELKACAKTIAGIKK